MKADCIQYILDRFDALPAHFITTAFIEHCYTARLLAKMYKDNTNNLPLVADSDLEVTFQQTMDASKWSNAAIDAILKCSLDSIWMLLTQH